MFEDPGKLCIVKHSILDRSLSEHLIHFIISKPFSNGSKQLPEPVFMNHSNIFFIETPKSILDDIFRICSLEFLPKQSQEHGEVHRTRCFTHHALQVLFSWILAKRGEHVMKIFSINKPILVMINHVECLLKLLYLVLVEHCKHIAGCSLGSLLGCSSTASSLAGGHLGKTIDLL